MVGSLIAGVFFGGVVMAVSVGCASLTTLAVGRASDALSNRALLTLPALALLAAGFLVLGLVPTAGGTNPPLLAYLGDISPADDLGKLGAPTNLRRPGEYARPAGGAAGDCPAPRGTGVPGLCRAGRPRGGAGRGHSVRGHAVEAAPGAHH